MVSAKHRTFAIAAIIVAFAMAVAVAFATPNHAYAASKKNVWVVESATYADCYNTNKCTFTYNKNGLLTKLTDKCSNDVVEGFVWAYDKKGNYTKYKNTYKTADGYKSTWKYKLKFDKKKRVKSASSDGSSDNTYKIAYNSKGRCKKYGFWKPTFTSKGYLKKLQGTGGASDLSYSFTRDSNGSITKVKGTPSYDLTLENTYENGRLASWTGEEFGSEVSGTVAWKQLSVPAKYTAKVKAQQRWVVDKLQCDDSSKLLMVVINK